MMENFLSVNSAQTNNLRYSAVATRRSHVSNPLSVCGVPPNLRTVEMTLIFEWPKFRHVRCTTAFVILAPQRVEVRTLGVTTKYVN